MWLVVAAPFQTARGQSAMVQGTIDCSLSSYCYIKDMRINGEIDSSTVEKVRRLIGELKGSAEGLRKQEHPYSVELNSLGGASRQL
jgi:hypothetical protein